MSEQLDIIKKYIEDEETLEIAEEILGGFKGKADRGVIPPIIIKRIKMKNIGNIEHIEVFLKEVLYVQGPRGSGKSWLMEGPLWAIVGACRIGSTVRAAVVDDIIGFHNKELLDEVEFEVFGKTYISKVKKDKKSMSYSLLDSDGEVLAKTPTELKDAIEGLLNINLSLINGQKYSPPPFYYSPDFSFQFTKSLPSEVEMKLYEAINLTVWSDLEAYTKTVLKQDQEKLQHANEIIGFLSSGENEDSLKKRLKDLNEEIKEIEKDVKSITLPQVDELNERQNNLIKEKDDVLNNLRILQQIKDLKKEIEDKNKFIEESNKKICSITVAENAHGENKKKLDLIKEKGLSVKASIESFNDILGKTACPILKRECADLKNEEAVVKEKVAGLEKQKNDLSKQWKDLQEVVEKDEKYISDVKELKREIAFSEKKVFENQENINKYSKGVRHDLRSKEEVEKDISANAKSLSTIQQEMNQANKKKEQLLNDKSKKSGEAIAIKSKIDALKEAKDTVSQKESIERRIKIIEELIDQFGKKGIPKQEAQEVLKSLNKHLSTAIGYLSNDKLKLKLNENFEMHLEGEEERGINVKTASIGEKHIINMAFMIALYFLQSKRKNLLFMTDDVTIAQGDEGKHVVDGLLEMKKEGYFGQLILSSSELNQKTNQVTFKNGKITK